jgi:hypothetical protein
MGTDVHIVLGRINMQAIANRPTQVSNSTALALFNQANIEAEDFIFGEVPDEYDLYRNYQLFGWLGTHRGDLRPYYEGHQRQDKTVEFLNWVNRKLLENSQKEHRDEELFDKYYFGDHSFIIFGVKPLLEFNYDEVVERINYDVEDDPSFDWVNPVYTYYRDPEGVTYRAAFGEQYFKFIEYCEREGWHFIVFGFDS